MSHTRRDFLSKMASLALAGLISPSAVAKSFAGSSIKALAFDAFPVFDSRPVGALAEKLFAGRGKDLVTSWRTRQFEYQWLRALSDDYKDFWGVTEDALDFAAKSLQLELTEEKRAALMDAYLHLKVWPDVLPALQGLKDAGLKLVFLSNMTEHMLRTNIAGNGLEKYFDDVYSTDANRSYKPSPKAYRIAIDRLGLKKQEIGFVAFAGWDASGAKTFGYPTYWVNRQKLPDEELGATPDWKGPGLKEMATYLAR